MCFIFLISNYLATFTLDLLLPVHILKLDRSRVCGFDRQVALVAFMVHESELDRRVARPCKSRRLSAPLALSSRRSVWTLADIQVTAGV